MKTAKGMRDLSGDDYSLHAAVVDTLRRVFEAHGARGMDTPALELQSLLTAKYGQDASKLIYDVADQGGELLSLRYDLTVPLSRHVVCNSVSNLRRYQIGKVWRRDQPAKGRYREFTQADYDIVGDYPAMLAEAEVLATCCDAYRRLGIPTDSFKIVLNHRANLDSVLRICGVPTDLTTTVCSSIDKLDKLAWEDVRDELVKKGLTSAVADAVGTGVAVHGPLDAMVSKIADDTCRADLQRLLEHLSALGVAHQVELDFSLARGLEYYTGCIFEVKLSQGGLSLGAGGRYTLGKCSAVGFSVGVDRVLPHVDTAMLLPAERKVLVASVGQGMGVYRWRILAALWDAGIAATYMPKLDSGLGQQLTYALKHGCTHVLTVGAAEISGGCVTLKDLAAHTERSLRLNEAVKVLQ